MIIWVNSCRGPVRCRMLGIAITLHREHVTQNRLNRESLERAFPELMFRTAIPLSTAIAIDVLRQGGTAADAAVAGVEHRQVIVHAVRDRDPAGHGLGDAL